MCLCVCVGVCKLVSVCLCEREFGCGVVCVVTVTHRRPLSIKSKYIMDVHNINDTQNHITKQNKNDYIEYGSKQKLHRYDETRWSLSQEHRPLTGLESSLRSVTGLYAFTK